MKIQVEVFWVMIPCGDVVGYPKDGGSMALQNIVILPHYYSVITQKCYVVLLSVRLN